MITNCSIFISVSNCTQKSGFGAGLGFYYAWRQLSRRTLTGHLDFAHRACFPTLWKSYTIHVLRALLQSRFIANASGKRNLNRQTCKSCLRSGLHRIAKRKSSWVLHENHTQCKFIICLLDLYSYQVQCRAH